jgi:cysteine desulfurase
MKKQVYLDYAAATPLDSQVRKAMEPYWSERFHNPSAIYLAARTAKTDLDTARAKVASILGSKPAEIIFTSGATEANNLAIFGIMRRYPDGELLVSAIEHESVLEPAMECKARKIPVDKDGRVILNKLSNLINDKTVLISVMMVNNELGTTQPLREISSLAAQVRQARRKSGNDLPLYLHSDAAQAGRYFDLHVSRLGVDLLTVNGGKIYGPKQSGVLFIKSGVKIQPQILGGGQEFGFRSGTESLALAAGFGKAIELAQTNRDKENKRVACLREFFASQLQRCLPNSLVNGSIKYQSPHILSVTFPGTDNERLVMELDEAGVQAGTGSACSASSQEPSHVLSAIGLSKTQARSTLRFSFGKFTTQPDLEYVINRLEKLTRHQR